MPNTVEESRQPQRRVLPLVDFFPEGIQVVKLISLPVRVLGTMPDSARSVPFDKVPGILVRFWMESFISHGASVGRSL